MRSLIFIALFSLCTNALYSQSLNHVQGELLIHVVSEASILELKRDNQLSDFSFTEVIKEPMSVWKISFDFTKKNEFELLHYLKNKSSINSAQVNHLLNERLIPDDPQFDLQWQYIQMLSPAGEEDIDLHAEEAWDITTGGLTPLGDTIVVCVIDDGLDTSHDEFQNNIWTNHSEIPNNGIDEDGNGYMDDYQGWNVYGNNSTINQDASHGTPVAGIIGAQGDNGIGVTGVNWDVKLMIVRGGGTEANALAAYAYPYYFRKLYNETQGAQGAFVVATNSSWGTDDAHPEDAPIWCNFYDLMGEEGILSCGATTNREVDVDLVGDLPTGCRSDYMIGVTNVDINGRKVNAAGYGIEAIDLGAFGDDTWTTTSGNGYRGFGGTSASAPHVTGAVALLYSAPCTDFANLARSNPSVAASSIKQYILNGVDLDETLEGITVSGGRLNLNSSLNDLMSVCTGCPLVSNVTLSSPELDLLVFEWEEESETTETNLRFRIAGEEEWLTVENAISPYVIDNPLYCSEYEIEFQSKCNGVENIYFGNYNILTEGCCEIQDDYQLELLFGEGNTIQLNTPEVLAADEYSIEWKLSSDSVWTILEEDNLGDFNFANIFEDCTSVDYRVQASCGTEKTDYKYFTNYYLACEECTDLEYCEIKPVNSSLEWIEKIQFGDDVFVSGAAADDRGISDFAGIKSFDFRRDQVIDFSITPKFDGQTYEEFYQIWIDFNKDGIFSETDELAFQSAGAIDTTEYGAFIIPSSTDLGITRMRVTMSYSLKTIACGNADFEFGETEDYCVTIREPSSVVDNVDLDIFLFPNPADDYLEVRNLLFKGKLSIYSLDGKEIVNKDILPFNNSNIINLPSSMAPGLYMISYRANGKSWVEKFVKI